MKWLRLYSDARTDAKLESLPDDEFRVWHRLLCFANDQPKRGTIANFSPRLLAVEVARGNAELLKRTLTSLQELRIIESDDDTHHFIHWEDRQYVSDNVSARVAQHRERIKKGDVTLQQRSHNVTVTPPEAESEEDTESDPDPETNVTSKEREISNGGVGVPTRPTNGKNPLPVDVESVAQSAGFDTYNADALSRALEQYYSRAPNGDVFIQIARMQEWLAEPSQQKKHRKMSYRFFTNWLEKAAEKPYGSGYGTTIEASSEARRPRKYLR